MLHQPQVINMHTVYIVTYGVVLVTNYWLGTINFVKLEKVACLSGDLDSILVYAVNSSVGYIGSGWSFAQILHMYVYLQPGNEQLGDKGIYEHIYCVYLNNCRFM